MSPAPLTTEAIRRLGRPLALTRAALALERAARAFWPLVSLLAMATALWLMGIAPLLSLWFARGLVVALALATLGALAWGLRRYRHPSREDAVDRLDSTLPGRPLAALSDVQAVGAADGASRAVWQAHLGRMAERLAGVKAPGPRPGLAARDPFALRLIALTALAAAALFGARTAPGELASLLPGSGPAALAEASWEGWIEPPGYTARPTLYLADQKPGPLAVPVGSQVTLKLYGKPGAIAVTDSWSGAGEDAVGRSFAIDSDGTLSVGGQSWQVSAIADAPPRVQPDGDLSQTLAGEMRLPFRASDDYGVVAGQATISLDLGRVARRYGLAAEPDNRPDVVVDLPMPFRGGRDAVAETLVENLARHPWAGLPVTLTLSVTDAAGQQGQSAPMEIVLPGRRFLDPMARAIIEMRRDILWSMDNVPRAARILRAVSYQPGDGLFPRPIQYLELRTAVKELEAGVDAAGRDRVAESLWALAVAIDDGALGDALERLRRAQQRLSEAMRQGASPDELSQLMDEYRQAMQDYMQKLGQQQPQDGQQQDQGGQQLSQQDLQGMMDRIEELMRQGRTDEAQQMLQALQKMMENARVAQSGQGQSGQGQQAMQALRDTLRQQQGLSDEAFRNLQNQEGPGAQGAPGQAPQGQNGNLSGRQRQLENQLDAQRQNLPGAGSAEGDTARKNLDEAGRAMDDAARKLDQGDISGALDRQAQAMESLREGMRNLGEALRRQARGEQGQQGAQGRRGGERARTDPLGRNPAGSGATGSDGPLGNTQDVYRRAQELMNELRRRAGDQQRPQIERDYIKRLLDLF